MERGDSSGVDQRSDNGGEDLQWFGEECRNLEVSDEGIYEIKEPRYRTFEARLNGLSAYSTAVGGVIGTAGPSDPLRLDVLGPLFAIAFLLLLGRFIHRR
jgi:hypothetical protein